MKSKDFIDLIKDVNNVKFAPPFMTRKKILKFITPEGKIISNEASLRLHRYMRISNIKEVLNGHLRFDVPKRWGDPFEKLFYNDPIKIKDKEFYVLCLCFIYDVNRGEESMWNTHGKIESPTQQLKDSIVRATFDVLTLCKALSKVNQSTTFYFAPVDYTLSRSQILQKWKARKNKDYTCIEEFLGEMLLKRNAFSYEHEMRLFAVSDKPYSLIDNNNFCLIDINERFAKSIITSVTLPPLSISNPKKIYNQEDYRIDLEQRGLLLKNELHNDVGYTGKIYQSRLYDIEYKMENPQIIQTIITN